MENLGKRPSKGILRFSEGSSRSDSIEKDIKWDEDNIKETLHPDDKDYGFMRIDEPPTPFSRSPHGQSGENSDNDEDLLAKTSELLERVSRKIKEPPVTIENVENLLDESDLEAIEKEEPVIDTSEASNGTSVTMQLSSASTSQNPSSKIDAEISRASGSSASDFELKRKRHYNEFHAVKLAKKLMQKELDEDEDEDDGDDGDGNENQDESNKEADNNKML